MVLEGHAILVSEQEQEAFGARLASCCEPGWVIFLHGELGAGKTTLVRGAMRSLGFTEPVKSPTFTLLEEYRVGPARHCHFDLYRLGNAEEFEYLGGSDYFDNDWVCWIEWPERAAGFLPAADLDIRIEQLADGRRIDWRASSRRARQKMADFT